MLAANKTKLIMISGLPIHISVIFYLTLLFAFYFFAKAIRWNKTVIALTIAWLLIQAVIAFTGFYHYEKGFPPRFTMAVAPPFITILLLLISKKGRKLLDSFDVKYLTYLQTFRFPVELVLYWLYIASYVPMLMTFEGRNWDIITGITAPLIGFLFFARKTIGKGTLLAWNIMGLILLFNIVFNAVLSAPTDFQKFAQDMPNRGVFYFPFIWLPAFLVPLALLSHLVSIRQIMYGKVQSSQI
jgi:hypothetical protein